MPSHADMKRHLKRIAHRLFQNRTENRDLRSEEHPLPSGRLSEDSSIPDLETIFLILTAANRSGLRVVQVGANDGVTNDPVFSLFQKFARSALLIEPQSSLIPRLRDNYTGFKGDVMIENVAISADEGILTLFELTEAVGKRYHAATGFNPTGIAANRREHLASHLVEYDIIDADELSSAIRSHDVPSMPLHRILESNGISDFDFLQVDTEGADWLVLQTLGDHRPPAIHFEWVHLEPDDWSDCREWVRANDYRSFVGNRDCLLVRDHSR